jgi:hypothetical protein
MNHRRSIAVVGFAGVLALAACGTDDQITQPAARPAGASQNASEAFQYYYDITHPQPQQPAREPSGDAVVEVLLDINHPAAAPDFTRPAREPSGDADVYVPSVVKPAREPSGDADVYVPSMKPAREPSGDAVVEVPLTWPRDAEDHPNYGQSEPAVWPLRTAVSTNLEDQRVAFQVELAALAERDGLTGLSPAFLQRVQPCSGLSPASTSGCTTDELKAALPGNPR